MSELISLVEFDDDSMTLKVENLQVAILLTAVSTVYEYYDGLDPEIVTFDKDAFLDAARALRQACREQEQQQ